MTDLSVLREQSVLKVLKFGGLRYSCQLLLPWLSVSLYTCICRMKDICCAFLKY